MTTVDTKEIHPQVQLDSCQRPEPHIYIPYIYTVYLYLYYVG